MSHLSLPFKGNRCFEGHLSTLQHRSLPELSIQGIHTAQGEHGEEEKKKKSLFLPKTRVNGKHSFKIPLKRVGFDSRYNAHQEVDLSISPAIQKWNPANSRPVVYHQGIKLKDKLLATPSSVADDGRYSQALSAAIARVGVAGITGGWRQENKIHCQRPLGRVMLGPLKCRRNHDQLMEKIWERKGYKSDFINNNCSWDRKGYMSYLEPSHIRPS